MKNLQYKKLINIAVLLLSVILYVLYFINTLSIYSQNVIGVIGFSLLGIVLTIIITEIFHEAGHLVFGLSCGLKLGYIKIFCIRFSKRENGKFAFSLDKHDVFSSETAFYPTIGKNVSLKIGLTALGGPIFSFIQTAVYLIIAVTSINNMALFCMFGISFTIPLYVFLINVIPFSAAYDGDLALTMLSGGKKAVIASTLITASSLIAGGVEPSKLNGRYLSVYENDYGFYSVKTVYLRYLANILTDENAAFSELEHISNKQKLPDGTYGDVIYELFFRALVCGDDDYVKENRSEVLDYLSTDDTPTSFRVQAALCIYDGDYYRAKLLIKSGIKICGTYYNRGIAMLERKLLEGLNDSLMNM